MGHVVFGKQGSTGIIKLPILRGSNKANVHGHLDLFFLVRVLVGVVDIMTPEQCIVFVAYI